MNDFLPKDGDTKAKKVLLELKKYIEKHLGVQPEMKSHRTIFFTKQVGVPKPVEIDLLISPYFENPDEMYLCLSDYRQCNSVEWDYFYRTLLVIKFKLVILLGLSCIYKEYIAVFFRFVNTDYICKIKLA